MFTVAWVLLTSYIYSENQEQKAYQKDLKILSYDHKGRTDKGEAKKNVFAKKICAIKKSRYFAPG